MKKNIVLKICLIFVALLAILWLATRAAYPIRWEDSHIHAKQYGQTLDRKEMLGSSLFLVSDAETGSMKLLFYPHSRFLHRCRLAEIIEVGTDGVKHYGFGDCREIFSVKIENNIIKISPESVKKRGLHITY